MTLRVKPSILDPPVSEGSNTKMRPNMGKCKRMDSVVWPAYLKTDWRNCYIHLSILERSQLSKKLLCSLVIFHKCLARHPVGLTVQLSGRVLA